MYTKFNALFSLRILPTFKPKEVSAMMFLPDRIQKIVGKSQHIVDNVGMSNACILYFEDKVLKIQENTEASNKEYVMMKWLQNRISVPEIIAFEQEDNHDYLLMTKLDGQMACDNIYMTNPDLLVHLLAKAIHTLWDVDISDCPSVTDLDWKLKKACYAVEHNLVDLDLFEPGSYGGDFDTPQELLDWLIRNRPDEKLVLSHGDFSLPNLFFKDDSLSGFIDLGRAGIADQYQDIALCYRSLINNFSGKYNHNRYDGFDPNLFFKELGIEPDWQKINYYILLDELF